MVNSHYIPQFILKNFYKDDKIQYCDIDKKRVIIYLTIGLIPYIRYFVLHNHAFKHYFFTYRAQAGTVLAIVLVLNELKVWETFRRTRLHGKKA